MRVATFPTPDYFSSKIYMNQACILNLKIVTIHKNEIQMHYIILILICNSVGVWIIGIELNKDTSIMQRLEDKVCRCPTIHCASPEDVRDIPRAIAQSEWPLNIADKIDSLENTLEKLGSKIGTLENTLMEDLSRKIGNSEKTLMEKLGSEIGNSENTVKKMRKTISNYINVMLNEIRKFEDIEKLEDSLEITLQIIQALATVLDNDTGNIEDQKQAIQSLESKIDDMTAPTEDIKTAVSLVHTAMMGRLNKTRSKESKDCPSEIGKGVNSVSHQFICRIVNHSNYALTNDKVEKIIDFDLLLI